MSAPEEALAAMDEPTGPELAAERRTIAVGHPMDLSQVGEVPIWRIESGHVDVFAIVEKNGVLIGNRHFVRSAGPGDLLFAVEPPFIGEEGNQAVCRLRAFAGAGAVVAPFDMPSMGKADVAGTFDAWLFDFCHAVTRAHNNRHSGGNAILPGDEISLPAQVAVKSAHSVVWADVTEGAAALFGDPDRLCEAGAPVPLAAGSWIAARGEVSVRGIDTMTVLASSGWAGHLAAFHSESLGVLTENLLVSFVEEDRRVAESTARSRQAYESAVAGFAGVLSKPHAMRRSASHEDPLTAACRAVALAMGVTMPSKGPGKGAPPAGVLERIVRYSGMPSREVTLYGAWWNDEIGPMIGFVRETNAPVALLPGKKRGHYQVYDPASGFTEPLDQDKADLMSPSAYVLYPSLPDRPLGIFDLLRFGLQPSVKDIGVILAMGAIGALLALGVPTAVGILIDDLIPSHLKMQLFELGLLLVMVALTQLVVRVAGDLAQLRIFARAGTRLQTAVIDRAIRLPNAFLSKFSSADLAQRAMVIDTVRQHLGIVVVDSLLAGVFSLASLAYLLVLAPAVALVAVLVFSVFLIATFWAGYVQLGNLTETEATTARASELAFQFVENISHLRAAGAEERAYAKWATVYAAFQKAELRANQVVSRFAAFSAGYEVFALAVFFAGLELIRTPKSSSGDLLIMIATYAQFIGSSTGLGTGIQQIFLILPKFRRAKVLLQATPEVDASKTDPGELSGLIEVSHLTFGYTEGAPPVLNDVSLTVEPGQMVAFVGSSGCGKSTMMKLLLGFQSPQMGSIYYDGQDLKKIDLRAVRRQIGVVLQEGKLMSGSIAENILGVFGGTNDDAWDAARRAGFAEDIETMPMGMHTVITDGGTTLSGGQVQRLLIARALVSKPRVMFLDEATSALDNRTQAMVTQSLQQMAGTRIVIAHRLSTIERADRIYVFDAGRIVQSGTYAELVAVPGLFAELAKRQVE